jgi:hypothetical protein
VRYSVASTSSGTLVNVFLRTRCPASIPDSRARRPKNERFVTARHCLQSLWKVAVAGEPQPTAVVKDLVRRFKECTQEKNCTLIRYDILAVIRRVYDVTGDAGLRSTAEALIKIERDPKYRKKYAALLRT